MDFVLSRGCTSTLENLRAFLGQTSTQAGLPLQRSHLIGFEVFGSIKIAPKGQTSTQALQPIHSSSFMRTTPVSEFVEIAFTGQVFIHSGLVHCRQIIGYILPSSSIFAI
jgi:hypothetical protein